MSIKSKEKTGSQEMKERYIYAVSRKLPSKNREDIRKEIGTLIDDMAADTDPENTEDPKVMAKVLEKLGDPKKLAEQYRGKSNYLIGPDYFDNYIFVLKIVLAAITGAMIIALVMKNITDTPANAYLIITDSIGSILSALMGAFAWVTVIFALINRYDESGFASGDLKESFKEEWKLEDLPEIPAEKAIVSKGESIASLVFFAALFILINYAPHLLGIISVENDVANIIPFLNLDNTGAFAAIANVIIVLGFIRELASILEGKYTLRLSIFSLISGSISLGLTIVLVRGASFWNQDFFGQVKEQFGAQNLPWLGTSDAIPAIAWIVIAVAVIIFAVENTANFYKTFKYVHKK